MRNLAVIFSTGPNIGQCAFHAVQPGAWTPVKIMVSGIRVQLYVNHAEQPCLIVNDLKLGATRGQIALWIGAGTEAYFSTLVVKLD